MKEQYRVAGVIMPNEKSIGFGTPYYQKVGDDKTIFYPDFQWGGKGKILSFREEPDSYKKEYYHIPVLEEYPPIGTFDKSYTAIVLRDVNSLEHVVIGTDIADAFLKVIELSKHYLLNTEAFLWVEKEKYLSFRDKIDENFICDVLSLHIAGIHSIDEDKWNKYWGKYVLPMYDMDSSVYCFEDEAHIQHLTIFLKDDMALHIHRLNVESSERPILLKSMMWSTTQFNPWTEMLEEKYLLRNSILPIEEEDTRMEEKKVIRLRKGEPLSCSCPYCHSENVRRIRRNCNRKIEEIIDSDYSGSKITNYEVDDFACDECKKEYAVDLGDDVYTIYTPSLSQENTETIKLLMESDLNLRYNFSLYSDNSGKEVIYYILFNSDLPIFVTEKEVETFLKKPEEAWTYAHNIWMTRHR